MEGIDLLVNLLQKQVGRNYLAIRNSRQADPVIDGAGRVRPSWFAEDTPGVKLSEVRARKSGSEH
jgi:hypothetical protein